MSLLDKWKFIDYIDLRYYEAIIYFKSGETYEYIFGSEGVDWYTDRRNFNHIFRSFINIDHTTMFYGV